MTIPPIRPALAAGHLLALWTLAVAQPLFDIVSRHPEFLVAHRIRPTDAWLLIAFFTVVVPAPFVLFAVVLRGRARSVTVTGCVGLIAAAAAALLLNRVAGRLHSPGAGVLATAAVAGLAAAACYARSAAVRGFVTCLIPATVVCPFWFAHQCDGFRFLAEDVPPLAVAPAAPDVPPVVVVVFDELPLTALVDAERCLDEERFTHFAALAREATWYRQATTVHTATVHAVPAILTGCFTRFGIRPTAAEMPNNLFTLLGSTHQIHDRECVTRLCPRSLTCEPDRRSTWQRVWPVLDDLMVVTGHLLAPADLAKRLPPVNNNWVGFKGHAGASPIDMDLSRPARVAKYLAEMRPHTTGKPALHFLHVMLPHAPYCYLPSGRYYTTDQRSPPGLGQELPRTWADSPNQADAAYQQQLLQIGFADRLLGQLVARLKEVGLYDRCVLVVTSDHGSCCQANALYREITPECAADVVRVPLLVKRPGQTHGALEDGNAQSIDVLPTVADLCGIAIPWPTDGVSLVAATDRRPTEKRVMPSMGDPLTFDPTLGDDWGSLPRKLALFGSGPIDTLYRLGPWPKLHGRPLSALTIRPARADEVRVEFNNPGGFAEVEGSGFLPSLLTGLVREGPPHDRVELAVALNGVVRGTCVTNPTKDDSVQTWQVLLPESGFRVGRNTVEVFRLEQPGNGLPTLIRSGHVGSTEPAATGYELTQGSDGQDVLIGPNGVVVPVVRKASLGWIDQTVGNGGGLDLRGWAVDRNEPRRPAPVLVFLNGRSVEVVRTLRYRQDLAEQFNDPAMAEAGFTLTIPGTVIDDYPAGATVRAFALSADGRATELGWNKDARRVASRPWTALAMPW